MELNTVNPAIIVAMIAVAAIAVGAWIYARKRRTRELRYQFGPEYDKALDAHGNRSHAESDLAQRTRRMAQFRIHPLEDYERARYAEAWRIEQSLFVDDPAGAVRHADTLVQDAMRHRGYPVNDFDQNAADLSVDHPLVVENYRVAHQTAARSATGRCSTEDLRKAMLSYRTLFEDLLERHVIEPVHARR